jgi:hypothetical protein
LQGKYFPKITFENPGFLKLRILKIKKYYTELIQTLGDLVRIYVAVIGKVSAKMIKS